MKQEHFITGANEEEIWKQVKQDFKNSDELLEYSAIIVQDGRKINLEIDIDLGGGFESGYETTSLISSLRGVPEFKFAIHQEHFTDEIGKFFGMQDIVVGFKKFDDKLIIKTNDKSKTRKLFSNPAVRSVFETLKDFTFGIVTHHKNDPEKKDAYLELIIEKGITDAEHLREIFTAFSAVLIQLDGQ